MHDLINFASLAIIFAALFLIVICNRPRWLYLWFPVGMVAHATVMYLAS